MSATERKKNLNNKRKIIKLHFQKLLGISEFWHFFRLEKHLKVKSAPYGKKKNMKMKKKKYLNKSGYFELIEQSVEAASENVFPKKLSQSSTNAPNRSGSSLIPRRRLECTSKEASVPRRNKKMK